MSITRSSTAGRASAARRPGGPPVVAAPLDGVAPPVVVAPLDGVAPPVVVAPLDGVAPPRRTRRRVWAVRAALVVALCLVVLAVVPGSAPAGTYTVESCTNGSVAGWAPFHRGEYAGWSNACGLAGGSLGAFITSRVGSAAGWTFTAPAHTEIAGFRLTRAYRLAANRDYGTSVVTTVTGPGTGFIDSRANYGGPVAAGPELQQAGGLRGQTTLTAVVDCGGGLSCTGDSGLSLFGASVDLRDDTSPTVGGVGGSLLASGPLKGTRTLSYAAQDTGGGVRAVHLLVDGALVASRALECSFAIPVPCPPSESGTLTVDTTRLAEGAHEATLIVTDATLANRAQHGPFVIEVDNVPPPYPSSAPRITGTTALQADDGVWTGANLTFERRWQRQENGTWEDVASGPVYAPGPDDAGHRLRFRVRASNAEGTGEALSEPTARLPGAPVVTTPTPTPTATPAAPSTVAAQPAPATPTVAAAPVRAATLTAAFASTGRPTVTVRWGERRKVTGVLLDGDGRAVANERVAVTSRLRVDGAIALPIGHVVTDGSGRFVFLPPAGASRALTFTREGSTAAVSVHVVPRITVRVTRGRIEGRVSGAPPGLTKRVELQRLRGRTWRTFATTRLRPTGGTFAHRPRTLPRKVRARIVAEPGWPFVTGSSGI